MLCCISTPVYWNSLCKPCFVCENFTAINRQSSLLRIKSATSKNYFTKFASAMLCFEDTSQDACVIHNDTEPLETQSFLRRLFNTSISTADVIIIIIIIIIIIFIYCNWVVTRWQWLCYLYIKHEIGYH